MGEYFNIGHFKAMNYINDEPWSLTHVQFKGFERHPEASRYRRVDSESFFNHTSSVLQLFQQLHTYGLSRWVDAQFNLWIKKKSPLAHTLVK